MSLPMRPFQQKYIILTKDWRDDCRKISILNQRKIHQKAHHFAIPILERMDIYKTPMQLGWFLAVVVIAVAAVFLLAVFVYYIYRTGNSATTSSTELAFRNFLENTLVIRPRTKEMIVGWPMLLLFVWSLRRGMKFLPMVFGLGMTIGLVSVVNTFLHIRTPFLISLLRTGWGVLFGLLIGLALVLLAELIYRAVRHICGVEKHV